MIFRFIKQLIARHGSVNSKLRLYLKHCHLFKEHYCTNATIFFIFAEEMLRFCQNLANAKVSGLLSAYYYEIIISTCAVVNVATMI